jgi:cytochrome oxidase Cu insertion factor (SCO1/SenC/PrrC family)
VKQRRVGVRTAAVVILVTATVGIAAGVGIHLLTAGDDDASGDNPPGLRGQATWPPGARSAADFELPDQNGRAVSLAQLRGQTVLLAFLSSHCSGACDREARFLGTALRLVPPPARPVLVIVSVAPGQDTPDSTRTAIKRWGLGAAASWHWLFGTRSQLAPVWRSYRVAVPSGGGDVRAGPVYLIDRDGFERAGLLYPFPPTWPAGDLRILAED